MTDNSLLEDFADETREHLDEVEGCLLRLESDPTNSELLNTIFRSMHTIKGASEYLGFERIARLSHRLENLLDAFREGKLLADKVAVDVLIDARDRIGELVSQVETSGHENMEIEDLLARVEAITSGAPLVTEDATTVYGSEADAELFGIFLEQLTSGLDRLLGIADGITCQDGTSEVVQAMLDQVDRLASTANYMGYDALLAHYKTLQDGISVFIPQAASASEEAIRSFFKATIGSAIEHIKQLFPEASFEQIDQRFEQIISAHRMAPFDDRAVTPDESDPAAETNADDLDDDPVLTLDFEDDQLLTPENSTSSMDFPGESDNSLLADFADETREHLDEVEGCLLNLESDPTNSELLNTIFRSMHTIKGASEYLGFERIAQLSHCLENLLDAFREGKLLADKMAVDVLIDARDRISALVSQIETSGHENAEIEDLLARVEAITSGSVPSTEDATTAYGSEADAELFGIFLEQLTSGLDRLLATASRIARQDGAREAVQEMLDQVERLTSTANYMGYDALLTHYETLQTGISAFVSQSATASKAEIDVFLQSTIGSAIECIQQCFPEAQSLAALDTTVLDLVSDDDAPSPPAVEASVHSSSDVDRLLEGLPALNDHERDLMLSKSLDETFASMKNGEFVDGTDGEMVDDQDSLAMQLLTEVQATDIDSTPLKAAINEARSSSFYDDFVEEADDLKLTSSDGTFKEETTPTVDTDGGVDLWPKAKEPLKPVPEEETAEPEISLPTFDFSAPPEVESRLTETDPQESVAAKTTNRKSIRIDADKVDHLMNQVGELVVNRSAFTQLFSEMRDLTGYLCRRFSMDKAEQQVLNGLTNRLNDATTVLGRVTSELQEQVMKVRMLPISGLFNRYPRLVHDLLKDIDKKVQLQFRGEETELDRMVIEQLADPMIHVIRNAVDHGIETVDERKRKGKSKSGILLLEAYYEGSNVVIEVTDDGKGIDLSRIRQKAVEKNLVDRKTLDEMDQRALVDLIMLPGFSTSDRITHTSGRGVGMDVVKSSIEKINGSLTVDTRQDVGTRFRIKIPLTLAIVQAMMIQCAGKHFTVPMSAVEETLRIDPGEIFTVDGSEIMHLREEPLPLVKLADLLNMKPADAEDGNEHLFVVVIKGTAGRTGFIVDTLLGRQEVVIKPMDDYLQENSGFSGATILGDGGISLVLDVDELIIMAKEREAERKLAAAIL